MSTALQLKEFPQQLRSLIKREADSHRRTLTQEAIVLLEEAVAARAAATIKPRDEIAKILECYESLETKDHRPMAEIIEYDDFGLPK